MRTQSSGSVVRLEDVKVKVKTAKALLCIIEGDEHWIPLSQIHDDSEVFDDNENSEGDLVIPEWLAREKGLL